MQKLRTYDAVNMTEGSVIHQAVIRQLDLTTVCPVLAGYRDRGSTAPSVHDVRNPDISAFEAPHRFSQSTLGPGPGLASSGSTWLSEATSKIRHCYRVLAANELSADTRDHYRNERIRPACFVGNRGDEAVIKGPTNRVDAFTHKAVSRNPEREPTDHRQREGISICQPRPPTLAVRYTSSNS